ncbi:hypothetical protein M422DRAFT_776829 [Sphaerobolus stellatus SS14]|nr:hypothetical protein M422DRAFT_776829 [Sphaerobolus stellatus SS14]
MDIYAREFPSKEEHEEIQHHITVANQQEYVSRKRAVFAPIRRLPEEILARVFEEMGPITERGRFVWSLVAVCKCWRTIGLSYASLWSHIHFSSVRGWHGIINWQLKTFEILKTALCQSQNASLNITFNLVKAFHVFHLPTQEFGSQQYGIVIGLSTCSEVKTALCSQYFSLSIRLDSFRYSQVSAVSANSFLPWWYRHIGSLSRHPTSCRNPGNVGYSGLKLHYGLLLRTLDLKTPPSDLTPIRLSHIRKLTVNGNSTESTTAYLVLPNLTELQFFLGDRYEYKHVYSLLERSSCQLAKLTIDVRFGNSIVLSLLEGTPSIQTLYLKHAIPRDRDAIMEELAIDEDAVNQCLLPNLRTLQLDYLYLYYLRSVMGVVWSRLYDLKVCVPLERSMFWYKESRIEDDLEHYIDDLRRLRYSGKLQLAMQWIRQCECRNCEVSSWPEGY